MDSLQVAAAEANSTGKQDSPRTIMIKANLKKVTLKNFTSMQWHLDLSRVDVTGDHLTVTQVAFCISSSALAPSPHAVVTSKLDGVLQGQDLSLELKLIV